MTMAHTPPRALFHWTTARGTAPRTPGAATAPRDGAAAALLPRDARAATPEAGGDGGDAPGAAAPAPPPAPRRPPPPRRLRAPTALLALGACVAAARRGSRRPAAASSGRLRAGGPSRDAPCGIHLGLTGDPSEMYVQFATAGSGKALVEIARKRTGGARATFSRVEGTSATYAAADMCAAPATSTDPGHFASPGNLHTVRVAGLAPDAAYEYRAGLGFGQGVRWSPDYFSFRTAPAAGAAPAPGRPALTFLAFADQGLGAAAREVTALVAALVAERPVGAVHVVGGLSLADGDARAWDAWTALLQDYAAEVPVMVGVGDHEYAHAGGGKDKDPSGARADGGFRPSWGRGAYDRAGGGECGVPVARRFAGPKGGNGIFWYSYDQVLVHTVMLSSEHNMTFGSTQYAWLEQDLAAVNRSVTPWLVVEMHRPFYNDALGGAWQDLTVGAGLQNEAEDLFHAYRVDLVISGHYRSYFRSCAGLRASACGRGGPTHVTVGTGGAPLAPAGAALVPGPTRYAAAVAHGRHGVGRASVFNATALRWEFVAVGGNVTDAVWLTREPTREERRRM